MNNIAGRLSAAGRAGFDRLAEQLPAILGAIALVLVGWVVAWALRALARRGLRSFETLLVRTTGTTRTGSMHRTADIFVELLFWAVLLVFVSAASRILGLELFAQWLTRLVDYVPTLAAGLLIIGAGVVLARFVGQLVGSAAKRLPESQRLALGRLAQGTTLVTALLVGADQIGIHVTWLATVAIIFLAAILGAVSLAASLGARTYVANLIGAHYLRQAFSIGETVRAGGHEGQILDITATSLLLETANGRVNLPGKIFNEEPIVLVLRADND